MKKNSQSLWIFTIFIILIAGLSLACSWNLHEDDIYWHLRAGEEILRSMWVNHIEKWSYTVNGKPWINYQWLSQVLLYLIYLLVGEDLLVVVRVILIAIFFGSLSYIHWKNCNTKPIVNALLLLFLLPAIFVAMIYRFHLRPDFLCLFCFLLQVYLYSSHRKDSKKIFWCSMVCLSLSAQFHAGSAVFLLALNLIACSSLAIEQARLGERLQACKDLLERLLILFFIFLLNPIHVHIFKTLFIHSAYRQELIFNTEWQSISWHLFDYKRSGWPFIIAAGIFVIQCLCLLRVLRKSTQDSGNFYENKFFLIIGGAVFTALSFKYIRTIPYQLVFFFPLISRELTSTLEIWQKIRSKRWLASSLLILLPMIGIGTALQEIIRYSNRWGLRVDAELFPVGAVNFIHNLPKKSIQPQIFSDFSAGSYMLWHLKEYPVFADHRDIIYDGIKPELLAAQQNAGYAEAVFKKYDINAILINTPLPQIDHQGQIINKLKELYPHQSWALIYFSQQYALLVRRIKEHADIIFNNEYHILHPSDPVHLAIKRAQSDPILSILLRQELDRCKTDDPKSQYCRIIEANLLFASGTLKDNRSALNLLLEANELSYKRNKYLEMQIWQAYSKLGDQPKVEEWNQKLMTP